MNSCIQEYCPMLARLTSENQIAVPKAVLSSFEGTEYFDVTIENGRIVLTPARFTAADQVRSKLADLKLSESDIDKAVSWARRIK